MFVGTHIPNPELIVGPDTSDKLLHFLAYSGLGGLLFLRRRLVRGGVVPARTLGLLLLIALGYAVLDELLQGVPGINRSPEWLDGVADMAGAGFTLLLCGMIDRRMTARRAQASGEPG